MKYQGSCHCRLVQFEFESEKITSALQCNCSICIRKNAIMSRFYIEPADFKITKGQKTLSIYHWGDEVVNHFFCKNCGIYPFHDTTDYPGKYRINLGCVEYLDCKGLDILQFDGKHEL